MPRFTRRQPPPPSPPPPTPVPSPVHVDTVIVTFTASPGQSTVRAAHSKSNGIPEIGGSSGGFIGLVVGLAVIMLLSCAGVFYLLKTRKGGGNPRKRLGRTRDAETSSGPSVVGGTVEMSFPSQGRFAGTFGGRGRSGWGRADSTEYDPVETADIVDEAGAGYKDYKRALDAGAGDARHLRQDSASSSASTIRLEAASPTDMSRSPDGPKAIGGSAEHPRYSQHVEPDGRRRATDESTLVSPTSIAHPLGVGGSKFHEMIT